MAACVTAGVWELSLLAGNSWRYNLPRLYMSSRQAFRRAVYDHAGVALLAAPAIAVPTLVEPFMS